MDIALNQTMSTNLDLKIKNTIDMFKLSKMEKMLSDMFETLPNSSPIDYIGELNKNDVML